MLFVEVHLDIACNALKYGRDPFLNVQKIRENAKWSSRKIP